jgi:hypothetical protein
MNAKDDKYLEDDQCIDFEPCYLASMLQNKPYDDGSLKITPLQFCIISGDNHLHDIIAQSIKRYLKKEYSHYYLEDYPKSVFQFRNLVIFIDANVLIDYEWWIKWNRMIESGEELPIKEESNAVQGEYYKLQRHFPLIQKLFTSCAEPQRNLILTITENMYREAVKEKDIKKQIQYLESKRTQRK